jgi:hypothetical protein
VTQNNVILHKKFKWYYTKFLLILGS